MHLLVLTAVQYTHLCIYALNTFHYISFKPCIHVFLHKPEYGYLVDLKAELPDAPLMALTATATPYIKHELQQMLKDPLIVASSINRPNITFPAVDLPKLYKHGM